MRGDDYGFYGCRDTFRADFDDFRAFDLRAYRAAGLSFSKKKERSTVFCAERFQIPARRLDFSVNQYFRFSVYTPDLRKYFPRIKKLSGRRYIFRLASAQSDRRFLDGQVLEEKLNRQKLHSFNLNL